MQVKSFIFTTKLKIIATPLNILKQYAIATKLFVFK